MGTNITLDHNLRICDFGQFAAKLEMLAKLIQILQNHKPQDRDSDILHFVVILWFCGFVIMRKREITKSQSCGFVKCV